MSETERIAQQLERTWAGDAWHGPSLKELTDGLTANQAAARTARLVRRVTAALWRWVTRLAPRGRASG